MGSRAWPAVPPDHDPAPHQGDQTDREGIHNREQARLRLRGARCFLVLLMEPTLNAEFAGVVCIRLESPPFSFHFPNRVAANMGSDRFEDMPALIDSGAQFHMREEESPSGTVLIMLTAKLFDMLMKWEHEVLDGVTRLDWFLYINLERAGIAFTLKRLMRSI